MDITEEKKRCDHEGLTYSDGTGLCVKGKCMVCEDGDWQDDTTILQAPPTS